VGYAVISLPYCNFALAEIHHGTTAWLDVVEAMHE
jgi:hypothetical protein